MTRRSGVVELLLVVLLAACWPYGFAGGGLPSHVRTIAIIPFDNETAAPELTRELTAHLRRDFDRRLGLREAAEERADAIVRGTIIRYDTDVPVAYSAGRAEATATRRRLQIAVDISIVDQTTGRTLWERKGLVAEGEYSERAEEAGRQQALEKLVNEIVEGAQSQW